ncbi:MAG: hypothetical protein CMB77_02355 [Euryarchaeota archaeon]|nr:hypothetical protein [Euryarchaeota archaeon]|tara:strand:- start:3463 stop:3813 length:351 start_codon:yes stop_codon:yes gene_type:complete
MANTFKLKTKSGVSTQAFTLQTLYTVPGSTTTIILSLNLCNNHSEAVKATVNIESNTSDTETNSDVNIQKDIVVGGGGSVEMMTGNKYVLQATDVLKVSSSVAGMLDASLSIMEIT